MPKDKTKDNPPENPSVKQLEKQRNKQPPFPVFFALWRLFLLAVLFFELSSCGGEPPEIRELRWSLNLYFTPPLVPSTQVSAAATADTSSAVIQPQGHEALSVFIRPSDPDGINDLDSMYLIQPESDLFWALSSGDWGQTTISNTLWIGSNEFSSSYMGRPPRGRYILELYDKAGERSTQEFTVNSPDTRPLAAKVSVPPSADELILLLPSEVSLYSITGYNVANGVLFTDANYQSVISLRELRIRNPELNTVMLSYTFPDSQVDVYIGPYQVPLLSEDNTSAVIDGQQQKQLANLPENSAAPMPANS